MDRGMLEVWARSNGFTKRGQYYYKQGHKLRLRFTEHVFFIEIPTPPNKHPSRNGWSPYASGGYKSIRLTKDQKLKNLVKWGLMEKTDVSFKRKF